MKRTERKRAYFGKFPEEYNSYSSLYRIFSAMHDRCYNHKTKNYNIYGGRGIKICSEWYKNYQSFCDWALANGYKKGLTIDRVDNNGDYCPENCRWVTSKENNNNTSRNRRLTFNGTTHTLAQWAEIVNIKYPTMNYRINSGWSIEKALTTPLNTNYSRVIKPKDDQIKELKENNNG